MSELDRALDRWACTEVQPDWDDVLRSAGARRRERRVSWPLAAILDGALLVLAAAPAFGVADDVRRLFESEHPGVRFGAALRGPDGASGRLELDTRAVFLVRPRMRTIVPLVRPGHDGKFRPNAPQSFRWRLALGAESADARVVGRGRVLSRLCAPCAARASGTFRVSFRDAVAIVNGHSTAVVRTADGTLRGRIVFVRRR